MPLHRKCVTDVCVNPTQPRCNTPLSRCAPAVTSPPPATQSVPIQTSPNWPLPSFLISSRDSRGISHISLVFTDKSASLGMPRLQLPIKRQHSPAALSDTERERDTEKQRGKRDNKRKRAEAEVKKDQDRLLVRLMQLTSKQKTKDTKKFEHNRRKHRF